MTQTNVKLNNAMKIQGVRLQPGSVVPAKDIGNMLTLYTERGHLENTTEAVSQEYLSAKSAEVSQVKSETKEVK